MRKLLNTLYVSTDGAYLHRDGLNVVVEVERVEKLRVPLHLLGGVAVFGQVSLSTALMGSLAEAGVVTAFFGMNGRFLARVEGPVSGNVLLRREQYRVMDDAPACTRIARGIVAAKALNQRGVLQRAMRDHGPALADPAREALSAAIDRMQDIARRALHETDLDRLRGHEGEAAALYFGVFDHALRVVDPEFTFRGRSRRPPMDPPNALLSRGSKRRDQAYLAGRRMVAPRAGARIETSVAARSRSAPMAGRPSRRGADRNIAALMPA